MKSTFWLNERVYLFILSIFSGSVIAYCLLQRSGVEREGESGFRNRVFVLKVVVHMCCVETHSGVYNKDGLRKRNSFLDLDVSYQDRLTIFYNV